MAKVLDEFDFETKGGVRKYDWATWLDGQIYALVEGEDYEIPTENFRVAAHAAATRMSKKVRTRRTDNGMVLQAYSAS
jgi:hypothetical protein